MKQICDPSSNLFFYGYKNAKLIEPIWTTIPGHEKQDRFRSFGSGFVILGWRYTRRNDNLASVQNPRITFDICSHIC